jgi:uncharacterized membrane protein
MAFRLVGRLVLAAILLFAGIGHFINTAEFTAQVPPWLPAPEFVVYASGVIEILLALALIALPRQRVLVGWITAAFFIAIFPGNISQFVTQTPAFGLDSDAARFIRLLFQPLLVVLALWSTGAWRSWRQNRQGRLLVRDRGGKSLESET